jgi:two-component sensor histidine kinase
MLVPHDPASAAAVRARLQAELRGRGLPLRVADDALLVVSELVSNAVRHGAPLGGGGLEVRWDITDQRVHLEVHDGGQGPEQGAPRTLQGTSDDERGRGLAIIAMLATSWGSSYDEAAGAVVWADLPVAATAEQQASEDVERRQEA